MLRDTQESARSQCHKQGSGGQWSVVRLVFASEDGFDQDDSAGCVVCCRGAAGG